jgi:hypothetical protein
VIDSGADLVLNALVGSAGLGPTVATLGEGIDLALANKESLVVGGELVTALAEATGARILEVDDGSIAGAGFYERCLKLNAPVLQGPKRAVVPMPAGLRTRAVGEPTPLWCWSLVTRADDDRPEILALRDDAGQVTGAAGLHALPNPSTWVPPHDPHRDTIAALPVA